MERSVETAADGQHFVVLGLAHEQALELFKLLGLLGGKVMGQGEVLPGVEELPSVLHGIPVGKVGHRADPGCARAEGAGHPALVIDAATSHDLEVLGRLSLRSRSRVEGVGEARPVDGVLRVAVHDLRLRNTKDLVERRGHVVDVVELWARRLVGANALRPRNHHRGARPAEVRGNELGVSEGAVARPGPGGVVHIVHSSSISLPTWASVCSRNPA